MLTSGFEQEVRRSEGLLCSKRRGWEKSERHRGAKLNASPPPRCGGNDPEERREYKRYLRTALVFPSFLMSVSRPALPADVRRVV
jgi:hypothetical protein